MHGIKLELRQAAGRTARFFSPSDHYGIYEYIMERNGGNHEEAAEIASWAELAVIGEKIETDNWTGRIVDLDDEGNEDDW